MAKNHLQLPPGDNTVVGLCWPLPVLQWRHQTQQPERSTAPTSQGRKERRGNLHKKLFSLLTLSELKNLSSPQEADPNRDGGGRCRQAAAHGPCLPQLLPGDSSPCSRPGAGNYREKSTQGTEQPVIIMLVTSVEGRSLTE